MGYRFPPSSLTCNAITNPPCRDGEMRDLWQLTFHGVPWHSEDLVFQLDPWNYQACADSSRYWYPHPMYWPWTWPCTQCSTWPFPAPPGTLFSAGPELELDSPCEVSFWAPLRNNDDTPWGIMQYTGQRTISAWSELAVRFAQCPNESGFCQDLILEALLFFKLSGADCPIGYSLTKIANETEGDGLSSDFWGGPFYAPATNSPCGGGQYGYHDAYSEWAGLCDPYYPSDCLDYKYFAMVMVSKTISYRPCNKINVTLDTVVQSQVVDIQQFCSNGLDDSLAGVTCDLEMIDAEE